MPWWCVAAVAALGLGHLGTRYRGAAIVAGVLKPLPIVVLVIAAAAAPSIDARYRALVIVGLVCSMVGDVCLVFRRGFRPGLASFLAAHVVYGAAFSTAGGWGVSALAWLVPFALGGALMLARLWPYLGGERWVVVAYVGAIVFMGWRAAVRAGAAAGGPLALAGALFFMTSDALLAEDRFARPFAAADAAVMVTYYAAQTLIAASAIA